MDAKMLVEDAKAGIVRYLKRKWMDARSSRAFDGMERWCLDQLAEGKLSLTVRDPNVPTNPS